MEGDQEASYPSSLLYRIVDEHGAALCSTSVAFQAQSRSIANRVARLL